MTIEEIKKRIAKLPPEHPERERLSALIKKMKERKKVEDAEEKRKRT